MRLFDCFAPIDKFNFDVYAHRPDYKPICLGPVTTIGNDARGDGVGQSQSWPCSAFALST